MNCHRTVINLTPSRACLSSTIPAMTSTTGIVHAATAAAHRVSLEAHQRASLVLRHRNPAAAARHTAAALCVQARLESAIA